MRIFKGNNNFIIHGKILRSTFFSLYSIHTCFEFFYEKNKNDFDIFTELNNFTRNFKKLYLQIYMLKNLDTKVIELQNNF